MSLGTGIFLSSIFLGIIWLYLKTRDTFNWSKIIKKVLLLITAIIVLCIVLFNIYDWYENKPKIYSSYLNINLSETKKDILFKMGNPTYFYDSNTFSYDFNSRNIYLNFDVKDELTSIVCFSDKSLECENLNHIHINHSFDDIVEILGKPEFIESSENNLRRIIDYPKYKIFYILEQNKILGMGIYKDKREFHFNNVEKETIKELENELIEADKKGDVERAKILANKILEIRELEKNKK